MQRYCFIIILITFTILIPPAIPQANSLEPSAGTKRPPQKWAIIIGVDKYVDPGIRDLKWTVTDAKGVYEALTTVEGGFDRDKVLLMAPSAKDRNHWPTRNNILALLATWLSLPDTQDTILIYCSGHGVERDGVSYFLPQDAKFSIPKLTAIPTKYMKDALLACKAEKRVLILDACHSGEGRGENRMGEALYNELSASEGLVTLASCKLNEVSYEWDEKGHGVFTYHLIEALKGAADRGDGILWTSEVNVYVWDKVRKWAAQRGLSQTPFYVAAIAGEIVLGGNIDSSKRLSQNPIRVVQRQSDKSIDNVGRYQYRQKDNMKMVYIPPGTFKMGDETGDLSGTENWIKIPQQEANVDAFYIDEHEVTNEQYCKFLNSISVKDDGETWLDASGIKLIYYDWDYYGIEKSGNQFKPKSGYENHPVVNVYRSGANEYAKWVNGRLPTETEWEKAARGGLSGKKYPNGDSMSHYDANYEGTGDKDRWRSTAPVKSFAPNGYGLYDMAGNVYEWCSDYWQEDNTQKNEKWHVIRGGSWADDSSRMRCSFRFSNFIFYSDYNDFVGFRVVMDNSE